VGEPPHHCPARARHRRGRGKFFLITAAAQLTTLPVLIYYFRQFSILPLLANFVILPAQPALEITAGLALVLGMVWLPLGQVAAWLAWPFSAYAVAFVEFFPFFQTPPSPWARPHQRLSSSTMRRCLG
jgi:predicted membrane metal-binding protein